MKSLCPALAALLFACPALADGYAPIHDRDSFLSMVGGKPLRYGLFGIEIQVNADGTIDGTAALREVTGRWTWKDGYFCREMAWGDTPIPYNCQLVEVNGSTVRFTVDQGVGDSAEFRLQ